MKFGIITLVSDNYGNKYQNYAVEQIFSEYGEVETYGLENLYHAPVSTGTSTFAKLNPAYIREVLISRLMYQYDINCIDKGILHNLIYVYKHRDELLKLKKIRSDKFDAFSKANLHISKQILNHKSIDNDLIESHDYFVCGSDQIWNPSYATTSDLAFCSFAPEKTVCLSPSFGVSEIPEHRKDDYRNWLKQIKYLSVRETAGQEIIKELTDRDAEVLLDPTMLIPVEKWSNLACKPNTELPEHYMVCYFLGRIDKYYRKKINAFARKLNLPVVMLFDITQSEYYAFDPAEVLFVLKNADYVLTDSFHGTVFSILFHRNFVVFRRNEGGNSMNSRLDTLLDKFGLRDRFLNEESLSIISNDKWNDTDAVITTEKMLKDKYLNQIIIG